MKIRFSLCDNLLSLLIDLWQVWYLVFFYLFRKIIRRGKITVSLYRFNLIKPFQCQKSPKINDNRLMLNFSTSSTYVVCYTAVISVVTQRSSPLGAFLDDSKNGCVADYNLGSTIKFWGQGVDNSSLLQTLLLDIGPAKSMYSRRCSITLSLAAVVFWETEFPLLKLKRFDERSVFIWKMYFRNHFNDHSGQKFDWWIHIWT